MTGPGPLPSGAERFFMIESCDASDAIVRLLGVFVVQGCRLQRLQLEPSAEGARLTVHVVGLGHERADHLRRRLEALPSVRSVGLGWRTAGQPAAVPNLA